MNTLIVLSALVSAALAVPYSAKLIDNYGPAVYAQPQVIAAPVYAKSYAAPVLTKTYAAPVLTKSYAAPALSYAAPQLSYGAEQEKGYTSGVSSVYIVRENGAAKEYAQPILTKAYAQPVLTKSYAAPVVSYAAPVLSKGYATRDISYDAPILAKSYGVAIAQPVLTKSYGYGLDAGLSYGNAY